MSKKITSFLVLLAVMLLTLPSHAQVQKAKRTSSGKASMEMRNTPPKALNVDRSQVAFAKAAYAKQNEVAAEGIAFPQWDWAAHAPKPYVSRSQFIPNPQTALGTLKTQRQLNLLSESAYDGKPALSRRAPQVNAYGVIYDVEDGELKHYKREGGAMYASNNTADNTVYLTDQSGILEVRELEDGTVYIKDIITRYAVDTWVKGTKSGNTLTIPGGQRVAYNTTYNDAPCLNWGTYSETNGFIRETGDITFTIDESNNTITLNNSENYDHYIGIFWESQADNVSFTGFGDYATVWTYIENYTPPSTELVELPEGAEVQTWYADGTNYQSGETGTVPATASIAFVGDDIYVSGIFTQFPNSWIKGTVEGSTVTFPTLQYLGVYSQYTIWAYAGDATGKAIDAVTFTYDKEAQTLTMDVNQILAANADAYRLYYLEYIDELTLSANPPALPTVPYTADFTQSGSTKDFYVIDNNGDGNTWGWSSSYYANYSYSARNKADDYLVLPIELEANKAYAVTINAAAYSATYPEKFEVMAGKEMTAAGMNITVIPETTLTSTSYNDYNGEFFTDEGGTWYIAIHATSDANMWRLQVKTMTVELGTDPTAPAAPVLTVQAGAKGALSATGSMTAPTKAINGNNLTENIERIDILCDNVVLTSLYDFTPGASKNFLDDPQTRGLHTYQAIPYNASGIGQKSEKVTIWVGPDMPADVENIEATDMTANTISFAWDPATSANGGYIDPAAVKYSVVAIDVEEVEIIPGWTFEIPVEGETLATVTGETTATINYLTDEGEIRYASFGVKAIYEGDESDATANYIDVIVGEPENLPIEESFAGALIQHTWFKNSNTTLYVSTESSDGDDVALALTATVDGDVDFYTWKLDMKEAANAKVVFDAKKGTSTTDKLVVYGVTPDGTTIELETVTLTNEYQQFKVAVPAELKNERWAQIGFKATLEAGKDVVIDNIKILDLLQYDLSMAVSAPTSVVAGNKATITATVKNEGEFAASGYNVKITAGNEILFDETVNNELLMFQTNVITAELNTTVFDNNADLNIVTTVTYGNDLNPDNDTAETIISVKELTAPGVTNVTAWSNDDRIITYWVAPAIDSTPATEEVTESFEEGDGGWTFIDNDGDGYNWDVKRLVDDNDNPAAYSGEWCVLSNSYVNYVGPLTPDNWMVSPEAVLDGTFKFYAEGTDASYAAEHFQVYVSTTDPTDVTTFEAVSEEFIATGDWKEYTVDLSAYAGVNGWIAIRHFNVTDEYMLAIDDITYLIGSGVMEIDHFNIYLDGEVATTAAANQSLTTIADVENGNHTVAVSVVYTNGQESKPVETTVHVSAATGIQNITVVTKPVDVYSVEGKLVRQQTTSLSGLKGVYIVDGKKVVIK